MNRSHRESAEKEPESTASHAIYIKGAWLNCGPHFGHKLWAINCEATAKNIAFISGAQIDQYTNYSIMYCLVPKGLIIIDNLAVGHRSMAHRKGRGLAVGHFYSCGPYL